MSELLKDIKTYLINQGIDVTGNIFLDFKPDTPDNIIVIGEYPGGPSSSDLTDRRIQILVRDTDYSTGKTKINSIRTLLDSESPEQIITLSTSRSTVFHALQEPFKLDEDKQKRIIFCCNFRVITTRD